MNRDRKYANIPCIVVAGVTINAMEVEEHQITPETVTRILRQLS